MRTGRMNGWAFDSDLWLCLCLHSSNHALQDTPWPEMVAVKKWLTWTTIVVFFLSGGIEYSWVGVTCGLVLSCFTGVILPTCWDYLHKQFGARKWLYSLTLSAMSISNLIMGPLVGAIYDKTHQTKLLVLFLNLFEIGGLFAVHILIP